MADPKYESLGNVSIEGKNTIHIKNWIQDSTNKNLWHSTLPTTTKPFYQLWFEKKNINLSLGCLI